MLLMRQIYRIKSMAEQTPTNSMISENLNYCLGFLAICFLGVMPVASTQELNVRLLEKQPPSELSEAIKSKLDTAVVEVREGDTLLYEFWFPSVTQLEPKQAKDSSVLDQLPVACLIGAAKIHRDKRDYRDDDLYSGVHTIRFALQPQDGNHLGSSEYPYFGLLVMAENDRSLDGIKTYKQLTKASSLDTASEHPIILSLRPAISEAEKYTLVEPAPDHEAIRIEINANDGDDAKVVKFDLVVKGHGHL